MATINYLYRSKREKSTLNLRLLYSDQGKDFVIGGKTQLIVSKEYWNGDHKKQRINDIKRSNYQAETKQHLLDLETHILKEFNKLDEPTTANKKWLVEVIKDHYSPKAEQPQAPTRLITFFDFYIDMKEHDLSDTRKRRLRVVKRKLIRFEKATSTSLLIPNVDDRFKKKFLDFGKAEKYAESTLKSDLSVLKTVCTYAKQWNIKVSPQLENLKIQVEDTEKPYLNFKELEKIKDLELPRNGYLDNARDWLIVSCYTGQRVSDFMRFNSSMIRSKEDGKLIEITQQKTEKPIFIPVFQEVEAILNKHNGEFPRPTSAEKYNDYIKEVCQLAGINKMTKGSVLVCIAEDKENATRNDYRRKLKVVEKHKLISSHIGRRSFATNFYGEIPTSYLIKITGHGTEEMFLQYIHTEDDQGAFDVLKQVKEWEAKKSE